MNDLEELLYCIKTLFEETPLQVTLQRKQMPIVISALEKQIPKKIDRVGNKCPVCKCYLASEPIGDYYCFNCGQAIDWEGEDE